MKQYRILAWLLACLLTLPALLPASVHAASSSEIRNQINALKKEKEEIQEKISEVQAQYEENADEIANIIAKKNVIDQEIQLLYTQIANITDQIAAYNTLIADKQDELDNAQTRYLQLNEENRVRIRTMEEDGGISFWEVIFKANSFSDLLDRLNMVEEIAVADNRRLRELGDAADQVAVSQAELASEKQELEAVKQELDDSQKEMGDKRAQADALLQELLEKADDLEALEAECRAQETAFLEEIAAKELQYTAAKQAEWEAYMATYVPPTTAPAAQTASSATTTSAGTTTGGTTWLVPCSYTSITSPFGYRDAPTAGASTYHQGVDLDTGTGWPVYATRAGIATTAYSASAGNYVIVDHQDGYKSVYMHLSGFSVSSGTIVSAGQQIGLTGATGIATGDHLHFGISYNGVYVNPCLYVNL